MLSNLKIKLKPYLPWLCKLLTLHAFMLRKITILQKKTSNGCKIYTSELESWERNPPTVSLLWLLECVVTTEVDGFRVHTWLIHVSFRDISFPLNRTWLLLSRRFSEYHLWMWNATIQRKFEAFLSQTCEPLSIIEASAKGEGLLCYEKLANKWRLARSCVQHAVGAGAVRPRHCLLSSPFSWVSRDQNVQGFSVPLAIKEHGFVDAASRQLTRKELSTTGTGKAHLKFLFLPEDFRSYTSNVSPF